MASGAHLRATSQLPLRAMPYDIRKADHGFNVVNTETGKVHARGTTKAKAEAQVRLLQGVKHGMTPRKAAKGVVVDPVPGVGPKRSTGPPPAAPPQEVRTTRHVITGRK